MKNAQFYYKYVIWSVVNIQQYRITFNFNSLIFLYGIRALVCPNLACFFMVEKVSNQMLEISSKTSKNS